MGRYRCPDHKMYHAVDKLCQWLREEFKFIKIDLTFSEVVIQAIVTHVYIEWIHLWRWKRSHRTTSRVLYFVARRNTGYKVSTYFIQLITTPTRTVYYTQLEKATETKDLSKFIEYALLGFRDGLVQTLK